MSCISLICGLSLSLNDLWYMMKKAPVISNRAISHLILAIRCNQTNLWLCSLKSKTLPYFDFQGLCEFLISSAAVIFRLLHGSPVLTTHTCSFMKIYDCTTYFAPANTAKAAVPSKGIWHARDSRQCTTVFYCVIFDTMSILTADPWGLCFDMWCKLVLPCINFVCILYIRSPSNVMWLIR